ncbi:hypothetical protein F2Q69_00034708 [Brassica cretica]|uniref:Serine-threonine/tyrosine-protein kinase catalytic domain-containing protein n=1 Tax=Brassica cretica TaxID=69181 RepID=A0A8S9SNX8_BRACR|nr:hypothetical protein F2Q69_00034708 [Brassica cretica]
MVPVTSSLNQFELRSSRTDGNMWVNEKCDVYGFGVLILELLTGRRLVEYSEDIFVILSDHVRVFRYVIMNLLDDH